MAPESKDDESPKFEMSQDMLQGMLDKVARDSAAAGAEAGAAAAERILEERGRDARPTRAQEGREAEPVHEAYDDLWDEPLLLDATNIKPRPGYVQYWVRTILDNKPDHGNVAKKLNKGWQPRPVDSVPKGSSPPKVSFEDFTNVVGVHGMLLMERPVELHERYKRGVRARTDAQMQAVESNLMRDHTPGKGFGKPQMDRKSTITRGVPVMDDRD